MPNAVKPSIKSFAPFVPQKFILSVVRGQDADYPVSCHMRKGKGCLKASWRRKSDVSEGHWAHAIKKLDTFEGDVSTPLVFIRVTMDETGDVQEYNRDVVTAYPLERSRRCFPLRPDPVRSSHNVI